MKATGKRHLCGPACFRQKAFSIRVRSNPTSRANCRHFWYVSVEANTYTTVTDMVSRIWHGATQYLGGVQYLSGRMRCAYTDGRVREKQQSQFVESGVNVNTQTNIASKVACLARLTPHVFRLLNMPFESLSGIAVRFGI